MTVHALIVQQPRANAKLAEMVRLDPNRIFGSTACTCSRCGALFVVIFTDDYDRDNPLYLAIAEQKIAEDCNDGTHLPEQRFTVPGK